MAAINISKDKILLWLLLAVPSIIISCRFIQATVHGTGMTSDSATYLDDARQLMKNRNFEGIGTHFPPMYAIAIAFAASITGDLFQGVKSLQLLMTMLNQILFALILWKGSRKALLPTVIGASVFVTSRSVLYIHSMVWSEGLFCTFTLLGIYFLAAYLERQNNRLPFLILAAVSTGLAFLTRYAGVTLIAANLTVLALYGRGKKMKRLSDCLYFAFLSLLPISAWLIRNWLIYHDITGRHLVIHLISGRKIRAGIGMLLKWFFIPDTHPFILPVVLALVAIVYIIPVRRRDPPHLNRVPEICFIFIVIYIPFLFVSISLFDIQTPLDGRILFPVYMCFLAAFVLSAHRVLRIKWAGVLGYIMFLVLPVVSYKQFVKQQRLITEIRQKGFGFASQRWYQSCLVHWIKTLPADAVIYTNAPDVVKIFTRRRCKMVPAVVSPHDRTKNVNIMKEMNEMISRTRNHKGVIIYFTGITWRWYLPAMRQLKEVLSLHVVYRCEDGVALEPSFE